MLMNGLMLIRHIEGRAGNPPQRRNRKEVRGVGPGGQSRRAIFVLICSRLMLGWWTIAVLLPISACDRSQGWKGEWPLLPYHGRLSDHPNFIKLTGELRDSFDPAAAQAAEAIGLTVLPGRFTYLLRSSAGPASGFRGKTLVSVDGRPIIIELQLEPLLFGKSQPREVLAHELVHATLAHVMQERYFDLPGWLNEGLATFGAGQGESKIRRAMAWAELTQATDLIDGLETRTEGWIDAPEDFLAIEFLHRRWGMEAVHRVVAELTAGRDWQGAITQTTGLEIADFFDQAADFSRTEVAARAGDLEQPFRSLVSSFEARQYEMVIEQSASILAIPDHPYNTPTRYYTGRAWLSLGEPAGAENHLSFLLGQRRHEMGPFAATLYWAAQMHALAGDTTSAVDLCKELLSYDPHRRLLSRACERFVSGSDDVLEFRDRSLSLFDATSTQDPSSQEFRE